MATVQYLKKKLRSIRSTQKISKAMKTASTVKYSQINALYSEFLRYEQRCEAIYEQNKSDYDTMLALAPADAPNAYVVMAGNKGMCGSLNSETLSFAEDIIKNCEKQPIVFLCGKQAKKFFDERNLPYHSSYVFSDVPSYSEACEFMREIENCIEQGKVSAVKIIFPKYSNMMKQTPAICDLLGGEAAEKNTDVLFIPDKETVIRDTENKIIFSKLYKNILETSLSAQAATLITMRSAYDAASELVFELERQINRKRQSQVTADVLETATEFSQ